MASEINFSFIKDFHGSRRGKIGSSDIPHLIPHPAQPSESLAAYTQSDGQRNANSAIDLFYKKKNTQEDTPGFAADMGNALEGLILKNWLAENINQEQADIFYRNYMGNEIYGNPVVDEQPGPFFFKTESTNYYSVAHADLVYWPTEKSKNINPINKDIDMAKPFIVEAKSARYNAVHARKFDQYKGYDLDLDEWQGVPLKHYFQVQFQMAMYNIKTAYVALLYDTNQRKFWTIKANPKHQKEILEVAETFFRFLEENKVPAPFAMNTKDIKNLYPENEEDYRLVAGKELEEVKKIVELYKEASDQEKIWKQKKDDAKDRLAIHLAGSQKIMVMAGSRLQKIAAWKKTGGGESVASVKEISKADGGEEILNNLRSKGFIKSRKVSEFADVNVSVLDSIEAGE